MVISQGDSWTNKRTQSESKSNISLIQSDFVISGGWNNVLLVNPDKHQEKEAAECNFIQVLYLSTILAYFTWVSPYLDNLEGIWRENLEGNNTWSKKYARKCNLTFIYH